MTEKRFHPFAVLHLLRKTILLYLIPLVQVLFARNWAALWAALVQDLVLFALLSAACWAVLHASGWQMDAHGNLLVRWRLGIRLDRTLRADMLAALTIDRPVVYRLAGASRLTLYPAGQKKPLTLIVARDDARELADRLLPLEQPVVHRPHGGEKMVFAVLGANGLSTLALLALALRQSRPYAPDAQTLAFAHLSRLAAFAARWLPMGTAWMLVVTGWLFCISLARSAAQVAHYTVWRTDAQLGSRGGLLHRYEMRLCRAHLNYADLLRSPVTRALHYCPVFVTAGSCAPELPLFVWKEGTPLLQELLPGVALPPDTAPDITRRSKIYFLPAGLPLGLCLLLTAVSRTTLPTLTLPLLVPDLFFAALLAAAFVGYRREGAWMQDDHLTLRRQKGFHLHCVCALHPDLCLTVQQSPWAVAAHRANLTLIFPGRLKQKVRSVALTELAFYSRQNDKKETFFVIKTVLFDLDGTLLNTIDDLADAGNWVCTQNGWPTFTVEQFKHMVGNGIPKLVERFSPEDARSQEQLAATLAQFSARYDAHKEDKTAPYAGIPELLDTLRANGIQCAVFSNKADAFCGKIIDHYFGTGRFDAVRGSRPGVPTKPDPAGLYALMEQIHADPAATLFVGDSDVDILTGHNAHLPAMGALWGFRGRAELTAAGADALAAVPEDIWAYIQERNK